MNGAYPHMAVIQRQGEQETTNIFYSYSLFLFSCHSDQCPPQLTQRGSRWAHRLGNGNRNFKIQNVHLILYCHSHLDNDQVRRILQLPPSSTGLTVEPAVKELQEALTAYLRRATETFDLSKNVEVRGLSLCVPSFFGGWDCASGDDGRS